MRLGRPCLSRNQLVYHTGFLAYDAAPDSTFGMPAQRQELRRVASRAWQLAEDGLVHRSSYHTAAVRLLGRCGQGKASPTWIPKLG